MTKPRICISVGYGDIENIESELKDNEGSYQLVELRTDLLIDNLKGEGIRATLLKICKASFGKKLIYTIKSKGAWEDLIYANLADYRDIIEFIDVDWNLKERGQIVDWCHENDTKVVLSYHDFEGTGSEEEIEKMFLTMSKAEPDVIKIALKAGSREDMCNLLWAMSQVESSIKPCQMIGIAMGKEGRESRICAGEFGSVITYGYGNRATASGQLQVGQLKEYICQYYKDIV